METEAKLAAAAAKPTVAVRALCVSLYTRDVMITRVDQRTEDRGIGPRGFKNTDPPLA